MSICLAILREHNGNIEAQPLPDGGTVFTLSLPVAKGNEVFLAEPAALPRSSSADVGANPLSGCNVLVVDDEEGIRELVSDGLAARGARVEVAASGEEALCLFDTRAYEVVICDVNLRNPARRDFRPGVVLPLEQWAGRFAAQPKVLFLFMTGELVEKASICPRGVRTLQKPFAFRTWSPF